MGGEFGAGEIDETREAESSFEELRKKIREKYSGIKLEEHDKRDAIDVRKQRDLEKARPRMKYISNGCCSPNKNRPE